MARDPGETFRTARRVNLTDRTRVLRGSVGEGDRLDFYRVRLNTPSSFNLKLNRLGENVDVSLLNRQGRAIERSFRRGNRAERIRETLDPGTYFVKVIRREEGTNYRLRLNASTLTTTPLPPPVPTPIPSPIPAPVPAPSPIPDPSPSPSPSQSPSPTPDPIPSPSPSPTPTPAPSGPPSLSGSGSITVGRGSSTGISSDNLSASASNQSASNIVFTLTDSPDQGALLLNGQSLGRNATFTQDDINNNRLTFVQQPGAQLPSGSNDPFAPRSSGSNVAWTAFDGNDYEIYFYNGTTTTQLTDNSVDDIAPQISGSNVVWQQGRGSDADIFFFSGGTIRQFSDDDQEDINPQISGSNVVWQKKKGSDSDIFFYNAGSNSFNVIDNGAGFDDVTPAISGSEISFRREEFGNTANDGVFVYDIDSATSKRIGTGAIATRDSFSFQVGSGSESTTGTLDISIS
jgi:hypothetical protein